MHRHLVSLRYSSGDSTPGTAMLSVVDDATGESRDSPPLRADPWTGRVFLLSVWAEGGLLFLATAQGFLVLGWPGLDWRHGASMTSGECNDWPTPGVRLLADCAILYTDMQCVAVRRGGSTLVWRAERDARIVEVSAAAWGLVVRNTVGGSARREIIVPWPGES